jgi:hypothetical protein
MRGSQFGYTPRKNCQLAGGKENNVATNRDSTPAHEPKRSDRRPLAVPARLTWKDKSGAIRFTSVMTRDVSESGIFVEAENATTLPLYRLVHVQLERSARDVQGVPARLRQGRVLSAVWRVGPYRATKGTPAGYALRFVVDPNENACEGSSEDGMAVAS